MDTAAVGVAQQEDDKQGIHSQDIFDRMVLFLAAITLFLFSRVLGADDAPFGPVMGKRGEAGAAASAATTGVGASSSEPTTEAASVSETPSRWCRQGAVLVDAKLAGGPGFPIEAPRGHMRLERGLEGRDERLKLVEC